MLNVELGNREARIAELEEQLENSRRTITEKDQNILKMRIESSRSSQGLSASMLEVTSTSKHTRLLSCSVVYMAFDSKIIENICSVLNPKHSVLMSMLIWLVDAKERGGATERSDRVTARRARGRTSGILRVQQ